MNKTRKWKPIIGFGGAYLVSNDGKVKSKLRHIFGGFVIDEKFERELKGGKNVQNGYFYFFLGRLGYGGRQYSAHRLVAEAFLPNPKNLPCINHIDSNKLNNTVENLEWCNHGYNLRHSYLSGKRGKMSYKKARVIRHIKAINPKISPEWVAKLFGCERTSIYRIWHNKTWTNALATAL